MPTCVEICERGKSVVIIKSFARWMRCIAIYFLGVVFLVASNIAYNCLVARKNCEQRRSIVKFSAKCSEIYGSIS